MLPSRIAPTPITGIPYIPPLFSDFRLLVMTTKATSKAEPFALHLVLGLWFGLILAKSEVISWYRIQEMFHFQAFHMYGVIGSAVVVGALSLFLINRFQIRNLAGETFKAKSFSMDSMKRYWIGGTFFGIGWALTGACPGPIYTLIGSGAYVMLITLSAALLGAYAYGRMAPSLPH